MKRILPIISMLLLLSSFSAVAQGILPVSEVKHEGRFSATVGGKLFVEQRVCLPQEGNAGRYVEISSRDLRLLSASKATIGYDKHFDLSGHLDSISHIRIYGTPDFLKVKKESLLRFVCSASNRSASNTKINGEIKFVDNEIIINGETTPVISRKSKQSYLSSNANVREYVKCSLKDTTAQYDMSYDYKRLEKDTLWLSVDTTYETIDGKVEMIVSRTYSKPTFSTDKLENDYPRHLLTRVSDLRMNVQNCFSKREFELLCKGDSKIKIAYVVIDDDGNAHGFETFDLICQPNTYSGISLSSLTKLYDCLLPLLKFNDNGGMKKYGAKYARASINLLIRFYPGGVLFYIPYPEEVIADQYDYRLLLPERW